MSMVLIMGESGSGKTTAMRNLDPETTCYIDADKKGLSWKGWRQQYNKENKNYIVNDDPRVIAGYIGTIADKCAHIKTIVVDTLNGLMIAEEMRRINEKGFDKWQDLATYIWKLIDICLDIQKTHPELDIVFLAHSETDRDDNGNLWTRMKTSGRKLSKMVPESKFTTVLLCRSENGKHFFETNSNFSTAKSPMGALEPIVDNDIVPVLEALREY